MSDIAAAKAAASRLWLPRPGVQAVSAEADGATGWKIVVYLSPGTARFADLPPRFDGFPVEQVALDGPVVPLGR